MGLGTKPSFAMALSMDCFFSSLTTAVPLSTRETVLAETPAACATMPMVTGPEPRSFEDCFSVRERFCVVMGRYFKAAQV
jgi:hypothetical protein